MNSNGNPHGEIKMENHRVILGPNVPEVKIGDLGSSVQMGADGEDFGGRISHLITNHDYGAQAMLLYGNQDHKPESLPADI